MGTIDKQINDFASFTDYFGEQIKKQRLTDSNEDKIIGEIWAHFKGKAESLEVLKALSAVSDNALLDEFERRGLPMNGFEATQYAYEPIYDDTPIETEIETEVDTEIVMHGVDDDEDEDFVDLLEVEEEKVETEPDHQPEHREFPLIKDGSSSLATLSAFFTAIIVGF